MLEIVDTAPPAVNFTLISPVNGSVLAPDSLIFRWNHSKNAGNYRIEISTDPGFSSILQSANTTQTFYMWYPPAATGKYYWRILAFNFCQSARYSETRSFEIFRPDEESGLSLWLLPDSSIRNGTLVASWPNLADKGIAFEQAVSNQQPQWIQSTEILNGNPVLQFDGSDFLSAGDTLDLNNHSRSFFIIAKSDLQSNTIFAKSVANGTPNRIALLFNSSSDIQLVYQDNLNHSSPVHFQPSSYQLYEGIINRNSKDVHFYAGPRLLIAMEDIQGSSYSFNSPYRFLLGAYNNANDNGEQNFLNGDIAEIIMYDAALSDAERQRVEQYLRYKYAPPVILGQDIYLSYGFPDTLLSAEKPWYTSYRWNTGDSSASIRTNKPGRYTVTVTDIFGYESTDDIRIHHPLELLQDTVLCFGQVTAWDTRLGGDAYQFAWSTGASGPAIQIADEGLYSVTISDTLGRQLIHEAYVDIDSFALQASLGPDTVLCAGNSLFLQSGREKAAAYLWSTGSQNEDAVVNGAGLYSVTVTDVNGCTATDSIQVGIKGTVPTVDFLTDGLCEGDTALFTDNSSAAAGDQLASWVWEIADSSTFSGPSARFYFPDSGRYKVRLEVSTTAGCSQSKERSVFVNPPPLVDFDYSDACHAVPVNFVDRSLAFNGFISERYWDFGDGETSTQRNPRHVYEFPGNYIVTLIATSNSGCRDTVQKTILVVGSPIANFGAEDGCTGDIITFIDSSDGSFSSSIVSWVWDFGDGTSSTKRNPKHLYTAPGEYFVKLSVNATNGCGTDTVKTIRILQSPVADFTPDTGCAGQALLFQDRSDPLNDVITSHRWYFEGTPQSQDSAAVHVFASPGIYPVGLEVGNSAGCSDSIIKKIWIAPQPTARFDLDPEFGAAPIDVTLKDRTSGSFDRYWEILDSTGQVIFTSNDPEPVFHFEYNGKYTVRLFAFNESGCTDSASRDIVIAVPMTDIWLQKIDVDQQLLNDGSYSIGVVATLRNTGTLVIQSIDLFAEMDNGGTFIETWTGQMAPGASIVYPLTSRFYANSLRSQAFLCVDARYVNGEPDDFPANNELCEILSDKIRVVQPYPNPANERVTFDIVTPGTETMMVEIFDETGKRRMELLNGSPAKGLNRFEVNASDLGTGLYFLRVSYLGEQYIEKFAIQ